MLIAAERLSKQYGDAPLLKDCSFFLREREKVGIIGRNGAGKSTLLKILAQQETPDAGTISVQNHMRISYLPQIPMLTETNTVLEETLKHVADAGKEAEAYEAKHILNLLGIADFDAKISTLSGGQRKRVALAAVLMSRSELLILDEPTNHLDDEMIRWLENYLIHFTGALLMVTHDRYFLERVVSKIVEVDRGNLFVYEANYSKYLAMKAEREEMEVGSARKRQSLLRRELAWMRQGPTARGTKSRVRIERFEQMTQAESEQAVSAQMTLDIRPASTRLGKKTMELHALSKRFGDNVLLTDLDQMIMRDARIGIVGPNGCGKSTLLKLIAGEIQPDSGEIIIGDTVKLGYFAQECTEMDPTMRVLEYVKSYGDDLRTADGTISATQMLERFLFPSDLQWNTISRLSGGERRRLYLLSVLMRAPNILLLDEPTNDLDIDTLMGLEEYIARFEGAVIIVSHDRYFLEKTTDHILEFQGNGVVTKYLGGYSEYLAGRSSAATEGTAGAVQPKDKEKRRITQQSSRPKKPRFSFKEQREYETIDSVIASLEAEKKDIEQGLLTSGSDYVEVQRLMALQVANTKALEEQTERWFYLQDLAEQIAQSEAGESE